MINDKQIKNALNFWPFFFFFYIQNTRLFHIIYSLTEA